MKSRTRSRFFVFATVLVALVLIAAAAGDTMAETVTVAHNGPAMTVDSVTSLGMVTFPTGYEFDGLEVGGLSGVAYDAARDVYYMISDDKGSPRFYTVAIDVSDGTLDPGDVTFLDTTFLTEKGPMQADDFFADAESIVLPHPGQLFISSEGDVEADPVVDPFINRFNPAGHQNKPLQLPEKFLPGGSNSVRDNLSFESLTVTPDLWHLVTGTESALMNDGPVSSVTESSPARILVFDLRHMEAGPEYVYEVSPIPVAPDPPGSFADNGLVDMQALDNHGTFLVMERSYAVGIGNTVRLFEISTDGATDVSGMDVLGAPGSYDMVSKTLVADFETDLGIDPDNIEGLRFGPMLPDGSYLAIAVSDNNFNPTQTTQIIALAVTLSPAP